MCIVRRHEVFPDVPIHPLSGLDCALSTLRLDLATVGDGQRAQENILARQSTGQDAVRAELEFELEAAHGAGVVRAQPAGQAFVAKDMTAGQDGRVAVLERQALGGEIELGVVADGADDIVAGLEVEGEFGVGDETAIVSHCGW